MKKRKDWFLRNLISHKSVPYHTDECQNFVIRTYQIFLVWYVYKIDLRRPYRRVFLKMFICFNEIGILFTTEHKPYFNIKNPSCIFLYCACFQDIVNCIAFKLSLIV